MEGAPNNEYSLQYPAFLKSDASQHSSASGTSDGGDEDGVQALGGQDVSTNLQQRDTNNVEAKATRQRKCKSSNKT